MKGKHKCKKKREDAPQGEHLATMNAGKEQKHTGEEDSKAKTDKSENPMNNVSKWWNDPAHVIQSAGIGIGVIVAIIYGCQLSQMVKSNKMGIHLTQVTTTCSVLANGRDIGGGLSADLGGVGGPVQQ
jgi:hypothetical protein